MLFNSALFIFAFLPVVLAGAFALARLDNRLWVKGWLLLASLFFYGWWDVRFLPLLLASILFNYIVGIKLIDTGNKKLLVFGVACNLLLLGFFKYAGFFANNLNAVTGAGIQMPDIILPLGLSFITFQKIAWLVDCKRGLVQARPSPVSFGLFASFYPQLIAGPIVHHREMLPQFSRLGIFKAANMAAGLMLFSIGLFKKVIIADSLAPYADLYFNLAAERPLSVSEAWAGIASYTFQIYFDFSGYSDMALGLAKMLGIRLPANFYSPYRATSMIDFWRRWHMTLSRFLRDYLYVTLGGSRKGAVRRHANLIITMLLGGLWHGAAWTFVIWGGLHGLYLVINHAWRKYAPFKIPALIGAALTFAAVALAWVFFRAADTASALSLIRSLAGMTTESATLRASFSAQDTSFLYIALGISALIAFAAPNSLQIMRRMRPSFDTYAHGRISRAALFSPNLRWGIACGTLFAISFMKVLYEPSHVFLYFQF